MDIRRITDSIFVAPQISPQDMPAIAAAGIRLVICNRPDVEVPPALQAAQMEAAAKDAGLAFAVLPLTHQTMTPDVVGANRDLMAGADGPVLAYCASGTRSTIAWALGVAGAMQTEEIVAAAANAGYDLGNLRPTLDAAAAQAGSA